MIEDDAFGPQLRELKRENQAMGARNKQLAELLKASRDKLNDLYAQLESLEEPANPYGVYLSGSRKGMEAEIFTSGRRMRVKVSPNVAPGSLVPGTLVRLGDGTVIVEACGFDSAGQLGTMVERIGTDRAVVADQQPLHVREVLGQTLQLGDLVLHA